MPNVKEKFEKMALVWNKNNLYIQLNLSVLELISCRIYDLDTITINEENYLNPYFSSFCLIFFFYLLNLKQHKTPSVFSVFHNM